MRRWVIVEAWVALGLRMEWAPSYQRYETWMSDDETRHDYVYHGSGLWVVRHKEQTRSFGAYPRPEAPQLGTDTMRHELAHYIVATDEQRMELNFGLKSSDHDPEEHTLLVERGLDAMALAAGRIAQLAMGAKTRL